MQITKFIVSVGAAIAGAKVAKALTRVDFDDMLGYVGLERRHNQGWEKLAIFGVGALAGAGAGLLLAPATGRQTRDKLGQGMTKLASQATDAIADVKEKVLKPEAQATKPNSTLVAGNGGNPGR